MAGIISTALGKVKNDWRSLLAPELILAICRAVGHRWRRREFGPVETVQLFLLQVLHGNTALTHLSHLWGSFVSASAFCAARKRLPLAVWQLLLELLTKRFVDGSQGLWHGMRVWLVDGSGFSMPDTSELARHFGYPATQRKGCGFPVAYLIALMDVTTGIIRHVRALPGHRREMPYMPTLHNWLGKGDVLVGDRGLCSFVQLAMLLQKGMHAVFRMHGSQRIDFTPGRPYTTWRMRERARNWARVDKKQRGNKQKLPPTSRWIKSLGPFDQLVAWLKPEKRPGWMTAQQYAALPDELEVRELRYRINMPGFRVREVTLVTTLLDAEEFPMSALRQLYAWRWRIETNFRHLKTTMGLDALKCQSVEGMCKELAVFALIYNMVRIVMHAAANYHELPIDRISFIDAQRWLASGGAIPVQELVINPERPNRVEPRMVKRRPKHYPRLPAPRAKVRNMIIDNTMC